MEKDLAQNLDFDHSFDIENEEVGGVNQQNEEFKITDNKTTKIPLKIEENLNQSQVNNMHVSFTEDQVTHTLKNVKIASGIMNLNDKNNLNKSNNEIDVRITETEVIEVLEAPNKLKLTGSVIDSEKRRMKVIKNHSQEQNTSENISHIASENSKNPSTLGTRINPQSINSPIRTKGRVDSLYFNNDETDSLKEVFNLFDKQSTGFVYEHDLIRILDIMNKDVSDSMINNYNL
jgi:hypothetical protein